MSVTSSMESPERPTIAVIAGATATGKSAAALALAEQTGGTIINADASQVYADLRVLTARPTDADMARAPHRLYGTIDGAEACSAAAWAGLARDEVAAALSRGSLPILVGGTGLYIRTLLDGIAAVPVIDPHVRAAVRAFAQDAARAALLAADPEAAARLHPSDRQRTLRALEVVRSTGRTLAAWQASATGGLAATHDIRAIVIDCDRPELVRRCDARVGAMLAGGALAEVERLLARGLPEDRPVLHAIGVRPLATHLAGQSTLEEARDRIALDTRRYAKRQATWWRNQTPDWPRACGSFINVNQKVSELFTKRKVAINNL